MPIIRPQLSLPIIPPTTPEKNIDIRYHKVRELISDAVLELDYIETSKMVADGLNKPLALVKHEYFITMLGLAEKSEELGQIGAKPAPLPPPAANRMGVLE